MGRHVHGQAEVLCVYTGRQHGGAWWQAYKAGTGIKVYKRYICIWYVGSREGRKGMLCIYR